MVPAVHPRRGRRRGPWPMAGGLRHLRMALGTIGDFAPCAARVFRPLRRAGISLAAASDQRRCLWTPRFRQRAADWQEVSVRNFVSEQGATLQPYWMYGKKLRRGYGAKGPATPADTPVASCLTEKNRVKLLSFSYAALQYWENKCNLRRRFFVLYCRGHQNEKGGGRRGG